MNKEEFLEGMEFMKFFKENNINSLEELACYLVSNKIDIKKPEVVKENKQPLSELNFNEHFNNEFNNFIKNVPGVVLGDVKKLIHLANHAKDDEKEKRFAEWTKEKEKTSNLKKHFSRVEGNKDMSELAKEQREKQNKEREKLYESINLKDQVKKEKLVEEIKNLDNYEGYIVNKLFEVFGPQDLSLKDDLSRLFTVEEANKAIENEFSEDSSEKSA